MDILGASLIEGLEDAVVVTDTSLTVIAWNGVMARLTGVAAGDALGRPAVELLDFLREAGVAGHLTRALAGEPSATGDVPFQLPAVDRSGWIEARYAPWRHPDGRIGGVLGQHADVTQRRRRAAFVRALEAIARSMASSLDLDDVLDTIGERVCEVMSAEAALIVSWDGDAPYFGIMRASGRLAEHYVSTGRIPVGGGPIGRAVRENRVVTARNILTDPDTWLVPERRAQIAREGYQAVAAAPLRGKGRVHGALVVHYWQERDFSEDDVAALQLLAEHAALAIDNARLYADATRRAERLREMAELEQVVAESLVVDDVLRRIARATARLLAVPIVQVWTADPALRVVRLSASAVEPGLPDVRVPTTVAYGEGVVGRVAEAKSAIYVADVPASGAASSDWARETGITRMLSVPVAAGEELLGVVSVRSRDDSLAHDENRALVTSFAARAALAMQHARTYAEAVRRASRLRDLIAVSRSITGSLDSTDVMQRIARAAAGMRPGALAAVHVYDATRDVLQATAVSGMDWGQLPRERPATAGLPGTVTEARTPVLIPQPLRHPSVRSRAWWAERPNASYYGVPINVGDTFVGVLDYIVPDGLPDSEEQEALRLLAAQAGIAIRNAALFQSERLHAEWIRALADVNQRMSGALELDELLRAIAESAASLAGVRFAVFWLADDTTRRLTLASTTDAAVAAELPVQTAGYDDGATGWVARHRTRLVVDNVAADSRVVYRDWFARFGLTAFAAYPVMSGDELLAILALCHTTPIRIVQEAADVVDMFLAQAAVAVRNARLYREARRRRDIAEGLARGARELTGTLDVQHIAESVTRGVVALLGTRGATLYRRDDSGALVSISAFGQFADSTRGLVLQRGEGTAGRAVAERRVVATLDIIREPRLTASPALRAMLTSQGVGAVAAAPLVTGERLIGALAVSDDAGRQFSADELQALQAFADQAALALDNARLYESARDSLARLRDTQAQLVQVAKLSALGQLVSGVAHELNNPLSVIIGYGQLLLGRDVPPHIKRPVELMVAQGDRMAKIVRNLLYFARQRPPERVAVELAQVIEQTLALRLNQLRLRGIVVDKDFTPDLPRIAGDVQQLEQVFLNLLLNAEQAILDDKPGGRITVRTRRSPDGAAVLAEVIDDGPGIPAEALPRVFEPFFTTKTVGMGTGLGLSVSYGIVQEHGGRLSVESQPGHTVFTLELPVAKGPVPSPAEPALERRVATGLGKIALVVEDEPSVLDLVVTMLGESGWRVDVATGGRAGLERMRDRRYDLVVSDMRMAEGDGEEFFRSARALDRDYERRFIFITGDTVNEDVWTFLEGTAVPVLLKPFDSVAFQAAVSRVLQAP